MNKFENVMIATDLDGTFLSSKTQEVARNVERVKYFIENGGLFTFATGRASWNVEVLLPNSHEYLNLPAVTCNGMSLYDAKKRTPVKECFLSSDIIVKIVERIYPRYPDICFRGAGQEGLLIFQSEHFFVKSEQKSNPVKIFDIPYEDWKNYNLYKLTMWGESEVIDLIREEIECEFSGFVTLNKSCSRLLEVLPFGMSKAVMIRRMKDELEADGKAIKLYAVGDYENDLEMLSFADVAVCPNNAHKRIKDICDLCLCSNNDGVIADLIDYLDKK